MINDDNPQNKVIQVNYVDRQPDNSVVCFIRVYVYDECGVLNTEISPNPFDMNFDGTPYTVTGVVEKETSGNITNNILDVTAIETITQIVDNNDGTFTYTNEANVPVTITAGNTSSIINTVAGNIIATHSDGDGNSVDIRETVTSLNAAGNILTYTKEDGTTDTIDLSIYLDDTNAARIVSGSVNAAGIATFTRDDATNFTIDFSQFFDDTTAARIVSGSVSGTDLTLTRDDASNIIIDLSPLLSQVEVNETIVNETDPDVIINNKGLIIQRNGNPVMEFSENDTITNTPDIQFNVQALLSAESNFHFMIDSTNTSTARSFQFRHNALGTTGSDLLFEIQESGDIIAHDYDSARDDGTVDNTRVAYFDNNGTLQVGTLPAAPAETITTLVDNGDGTATYTNEANTAVTIPTSAVKEYWHGVGGATQTLNNATVTTTNITQDINSDAAVFSLSGNVVTVNKTGVFKVEYSGTSDTADGGRRGMLFDLYVNGTKQNAEGYTYSRNNASGENTASNRKILSLTSGDTVEIRMNRNSTGSVQTVPSGISLTIEEK